MKITVFGANGGVARHAVEQMLRAGHEVTAVVRNPGTLSARPRLRVEVVPDPSQPRQLAAALRETDAVLSGVGPRSTRDGPIASRVTASIIAAMTEAGVRRLITVSAAPVGEMPADEGLFGRLVLYPIARTVLRTVFDDLARMEQEMWRSGLDATSVRPPRLTNGPWTGKYRQRIGG